MATPATPPNGRSILLFGVAALLVVATVPYFVPMRPAVSDSYIFGYNNRAGIALFLLFAAVGAWWTRGKTLPGGHIDAKWLPRTYELAAVVVAFLLSYGMYRLVAPLNGFAESTYFLHRLNLLAAGRVPYREFEFAYGAALLYGPLWLARALHVSLAQGYYWFWIATVVAGNALLFESLRMAGDEREDPHPSKPKPGLPGTPDRRGIFWVFYAISLFGILTTGLNYTLLRFVLPLYAAAWVERTRAKNFGAACAVALGATLVLLVISPEMAVGFAIGSLIYFAISIEWHEKSLVIWMGALVLALAMTFAIANSLGVFMTMRAFSAGGNNFPVYVAPSIALFLAVVWCGFQLLLQGVSGILRYWILLGVVMIPAALGRCDTGHILSYTMGIFLAVALVLSRARRWRLGIRIAGVAYVLVFIVPALPVEYIPFTARAAARSGSSVAQRYAKWALGAEKAQGIRENVVTPRLDLPPGEKLLAPFSYRPNGQDVVNSPAIEYGYYEGMTNVLTPEQINFKLQEIETHPEMPLLLPRQWVSYCVRTSDNSRQLLSGLFGVPYIKQPAHEMDLYMPVCNYIRASYRYLPTRAEQEFGEFDLWGKK
ncbi:MAG TPA: hypothetical protein VGL89_02980 [Candidatus Koribacter sp.]|jgi:hypothetical protein